MSAKLAMYNPGAVAKIIYPNGEQMVISMGTSTIKMFIQRTLVGWVLPKTIWNRAYVQICPDWSDVIGVTREVMKHLLLAGIADIAASCDCIEEAVRKCDTFEGDLAEYGGRILDSQKIRERED